MDTDNFFYDDKDDDDDYVGEEDRVKRYIE